MINCGLERRTYTKNDGGKKSMCFGWGDKKMTGISFEGGSVSSGAN